jgi:HSP20 family molecular chaperone IbpA
MVPALHFCMKRGLTVERVLLASIVVLQVAHLLLDYRRGSNAVHDASEPVVVAEPVASAPLPARPQRLDPLDAMNVMMAHAVQDLERMSSMVVREERWQRLGAEPSMDMRDRDEDYLVAVGLPAYVDPGLLAVSLEGRLLTITARHAASPLLAPVKVFERHIQLPGPVAGEDGARASVSNGVLRVSLPKAAPQMYPPAQAVRYRLF